MVQVTFKTKMTSIELALWRWLVQTWGSFFLLRASSSMHYEYIYMVHVTFKKRPLWSLVHARHLEEEKSIFTELALGRYLHALWIHMHGSRHLQETIPSTELAPWRRLVQPRGWFFSWLHGASSSEAIGAEVVVIFSSVELAPRTIHMHGSCQFQEKYHTSKYIAWFRAVYLQVYILDDSVLVLFFFDALWTIHIVQPLGFSHCFCHLNSLWKHIQGSRHIKSKSYSSMDDLSSARNSVLWLLAVWKYIRDN